MPYRRRSNDTAVVYWMIAALGGVAVATLVGMALMGISSSQWLIY